MFLPASSFKGNEDGGVRVMNSQNDPDQATRIMSRFENSSSVRENLLCAIEQGSTELIRRDGTRRISPFILLIDEDPEFSRMDWSSRMHRTDQWTADHRSLNEAAYDSLGLKIANSDRNEAVGGSTGAVSSDLIVGPAGRNPRNQSCPCGSGRKYKHCHGH